MDSSLLEGAYPLLSCVTGALLTVLLLRLPVRRVFGPQITYTLWLFVPIAVVGSVAGSLAPVRAFALTVLPVQVSSIRLLWSAFPAGQAPFGEANWIVIGWLVGAVLLALIQWRQQCTFVQRLGALQPTPTGTWMAEAHDVGPMVVGVFPPRIVLPADFHRRYTRQERVLVLAHESMHIARRDPFANLATAAVRSLLWFHPLVHLAIRYFRIDQEFACDAAVLQVHPWERHHYAYALLKGQIRGPLLPAGCHLDSHAAISLKRRIIMLQTPSQSRGRRALGTIVVATAVIIGGSLVTLFTACNQETPTSTVPDRISENLKPTTGNVVFGWYVEPRILRGN